jgi:hypothetical protein
MEIENRKIVSTMLGTEDHGILTSQLVLEGDGFGVGFGGNTFDEPRRDSKGKFVGRRGHAFGMEYIRALPETLEVGKWEDLPGKHVRVETDGIGSKVTRIGHIIKDRWFSPEALFREFFPEEKQ